MPTFTGTTGNDTLTGTEEADIINGLAGDDQLYGLGGNDTLYGDEGADHLIGGEGNDVLDGGAPHTGTMEHEFRSNVLEGGPGNDIYYTGGFNWFSGSRFQNDIINELAGQGYDIVFTSRSYAMNGSEIEELRLTTASADKIQGFYDVGLIGNNYDNAIYGHDGSQYLDGSGGSDRLYGLAGNDVLMGGAGDDLLVGGEGSDALNGNEGNDTFFADSSDWLNDQPGQGDDTVVVSSGYVIPAGVSIETLRTSAPTSTAALVLSGNEFGQSIYGNAGDNVLNGFGGIDYLVGIGGNDTLDGGTGADFLRGGIGNDLYRVDNAGDLVFEAAGEGDDRVAASVSYTLAGGVDVETLSTTSGIGTDPINLIGNELGQSIYGNDGNNILNGMGGIDFLVGRKGNDTFIVDHSGDVISEVAGEGDDVLSSSVNHRLAAGLSIETMVAASGFASIELTGNEVGQSLYGNSGNNVLDGRGGVDYLHGGGGNDLFAFTTAPGAGNVDVIGDFQAGIDRIGIDNAVFAGLDGGALAAGAFRTGTSAQDSDDRIIYDPATGALWFDADGNGSGAAVQFALLQPNLGITSSDFVVI